LSYPHPRQPTVRFLNPNASERSSMKNPEKFNALDGKRFVVRAEEKLTAFLELESAIRAGRTPSRLRSA
jgi:hypothetical protein